MVVKEMTLDEKRATDVVTTRDGVEFVVDPESAPYLNGATLDQVGSEEEPARLGRLLQPITAEVQRDIAYARVADLLERTDFDKYRVRHGCSINLA